MAIGFYGGIKIKKSGLSHGAATQTVSSPAVAINITQQAGGETTPCVAQGEYVKKGQVIAKSEMLAFLHAPVSGTVVQMHEDENDSYIVIKSDGTEAQAEYTPFTKPISEISSDEIAEQVRIMGVVGTYSGFPTHIKIIAAREKAFCLVVNCIQSEPYGSFVREIIKEHPTELIYGARILAKAVGVKSVIFAVENNERKAYNALTEKLDEKEKLITVTRLAAKYPLGEERNLLCEIIGKEVPAGRATHDIGYTVFSAETVLRVYEACAVGKAVTDKYITVSGEKAKKPANLLVPLGTSLRKVTEQCGGIPEGAVCIYGGSINGKCCDIDNTCVTKHTSVLIIADNEDNKEKIATQCIRCGRCVLCCPMHLAPHTFVNGKHNPRWVKLCDMCGCCQYVCPSHIKLLDIIDKHKKEAL